MALLVRAVAQTVIKVVVVVGVRKKTMAVAKSVGSGAVARVGNG